MSTVPHQTDDHQCVAPDLAERLALARAYLRECAPGLQERPEPGRQPRFAYAAASGAIVFRLVVDPPNLLLHLADGAILPDPAARLRGAGRRGRYICLRDTGVLADAAVRTLILEAIAQSARSPSR